MQFSARGSKDPDNAPQPLKYRWDLGDGIQATTVEVSHRYKLPGTYVVTLTVNDGSDQSVDQTTIVVLPRVAAGRRWKAELDDTDRG
ncbi:MAG: PKD repeat protein [Verrucomicrobiales bacterium]